MTTQMSATKESITSFQFWTGLVFAIVTSLAVQAQAKVQNVDAKGKEGAKVSAKHKLSKKFALKTSAKFKTQIAKHAVKPAAKVARKTPFKMNGKSKQIAKAPAKASTHELAAAFSTNQQNQLIVQNSKPRAAQKEAQSKKMPSLLPTSNDSQRAANMLEADSGVHGDDGYTRTQIVDAPTIRRPAAASSKAPERVAITFARPQDK